MSSLRTLCLALGPEHFLLFPPQKFDSFYILTFKSVIYFELIFVSGVAFGLRLSFGLWMSTRRTLQGKKQPQRP